MSSESSIFYHLISILGPWAPAGETSNLGKRDAKVEGDVHRFQASPNWYYSRCKCF